MRKISVIFLGCLLFAGAAFAQQKSRECQNEEKRARDIHARCSKMDRKANGYQQCVAEFREQRAKAERACRVASVASSESLEEAVKRWENLSNTNRCRTPDASKNPNCAMILQQWGQELYKLGEVAFSRVSATHDSLVQWCADRDNNVQRFPQCARTSQFPKPNHDAALPIFLDYVKYFPDGPGAPNMLFQASFILETKGEADQALRLRQTLVSKYPNHTLAPSAWLRIGLHHYNNSKWNDAIRAYERITGANTRNLTNRREATYAMYHLAECYYNQAEYEIAAEKFWEYIDGADKGIFIKDLRVEAMDFMATAFSDLDNGIEVAEKFMRNKKVPYRDSLYFRIGQKAKDHDRHDQAVQAFEYLLRTNPNYIDAPLADLAMVEIFLLQQKPDRAQEQRHNVVKRYDRNSSWFKQNSRYPESVANAERAIRLAMLDIPIYMHVQGAELFKRGDTEGAKKQYAAAIKAYGDFLSRYKNEPDWNEYKVYMNMAVIYNELKQHEREAAAFNWIVDVDTTKYGRRPQNFGILITKNDAAYNAVLAMDAAREAALKTKAGGDTVRAYNLPETKAYFDQVARYMSRFGRDTAAPTIAYNAAVVHYQAKQFKRAINELTQLKTNFPNHKYTLLIHRMLAQSLLEDGQLDEAQKEFEWLFTQYTARNGLGVRDSNAVAIAREVETSIAAVLYQKAERAVKAGQHQAGADAYVALVRRFPRAEFSDRALFEAGVAYENAGQHVKAAETWMRLPKEYGKSNLAIRSIVRAALAYKKAGRPVDAAKTYLFITENYPQDTMAITAIFAAAQTYDSLPGRDSAAIRANKRLAAQTYEIAFKRFPRHEKTPSLLYNACLAYDDARDTKEAIRCNKDLVREYPRSSYALDAAYSIPLAYENAKDWANAIKEFESFVRNYTTDKEKLINAYTRLGRAHLMVRDTTKAAAAFRQTIANYDRFGVQLTNPDPAFAAEAAFMLGEFERVTMSPIVVRGNERAKLDIVRRLMTILQNATKHYAKSSEYASEKWTFRAKNRIAELFVAVSAKVREQEIDVRDRRGNVDKEKLFVERILVVQQLPSYYEQARPLFQANIDLAREQGYWNPDVVAAEEGFIEMFYRDCANFYEVGNAFAEAPLPDSAAIVREYIEFEGMVREDAVLAAHEDLEAYREELQNKSQTAKQGALPRCSNGIRASAHYGIHNRWTDSLFALVRRIDADNEILATRITKFDPSTLFRDDHYNRTKARLTQIERSEDLTPQEQAKVYREISAEAKSRNERLKRELASLRAQMRAREAPATEAGL
ncbi:MAG: tetratricopeptide repeat protein [Fibromonadaceae bacterium]|jgi:TolA-binding protein|nr:tetratricopeptide repeat protein [Fibromonadaceae bacterium]